MNEKNKILQEIWQEIQLLQKNRLFLCNLGILGIIAISLALILGEGYDHSQNHIQQEQLTRFSNSTKTLIELKTHKSLLN